MSQNLVKLSFFDYPQYSLNVLLVSILIVLGIILVVESGLRFFLGFGNPPLYLADEKIGYLLAPNQETRRRGNKIKINQYSMRSDEISPQKAEKTTRVFLLGDSIVNGGWWTDQKSILSALIKQELGNELAINQLEVFNASANSWSPRNELAYLRRFGLFEADILVVVINTDDLFGTAPNSAIVGQDPNYPDTKPFLALIELYERYLKKTQPIAESKQIKQEGGDRVGFNLEAIDQIKAIADNNQTQFVLALTPLKRELKEGSKNHEQKARKRLQEFVYQRKISYIDFLPLFAASPQPELLYRDHIHLSPQGETIVSQTITEAIQPIIKEREKRN